MDQSKKSIKISTLIRKLLQKYEEDTYYSTDSDCDYTIVTKIERTPRIIKVEREEVSFDCISNINSDLIESKIQNSINYEEAKLESWELPLKVEINEKNDKKPLKCQICKRTIKVKALDTHLDKCLRKNVNLLPIAGIFKCVICENTMKYRRSLMKHYKLYHSPNATRVIKVKNNSEYLQFECYMCEKRMKHKRSLLKHYRLFHPVVAGNNEDEIENNSFDSAITDHKCTVCRKSYSHLQSLYRHMRKSHRIFRRSIPKPKETSLCNFCGKNFACLWNLNCHIKLCHTDVKPFICDICSMQFRYKEQLKDHLLNHVNSKPYVCKYAGCTSTFTKYSAWNRHNVRHTHFEKKIVERKFPCPFCGKKFQSKTKVRIHIRTHTNERPYSCETCFRAFKERFALTLHRRTHTNERPHSCRDCDKAYTKSSALKAHILRCHQFKVELNEFQ